MNYIKSEVFRKMTVMNIFLEKPSKLTKKDLMHAKILARGISDRCWFNIGWHAASPNKPLSGKNSTETLIEELLIMVNFLGDHATSVGRQAKPPELEPGQFLVIAEYVKHEGQKSWEACVKTVALKGHLGKNKRPDRNAVSAMRGQIKRQLKKIGKAYGYRPAPIATKPKAKLRLVKS